MGVKMAAGCAAAALGLAAVLVGVDTVSVSIPQAAVQAAVNGKLPLTKQFGPVRATLTDARVEFRPDARVGVSAGLSTEAGPLRLSARTIGSAVVEYTDGAFYLRRAAVEEVVPPSAKEGRVSLMSGAFEMMGPERIEALKKAATLALEDGLEKRPVYVLNDAKQKERIARATLRSVSVDNGVVTAVLDPLPGGARPVGWGIAAMLALGTVVSLAVRRRPTPAIQGA